MDLGHCTAWARPNVCAGHASAAEREAAALLLEVQRGSTVGADRATVASFVADVRVRDHHAWREGRWSAITAVGPPGKRVIT